MFISRFETPVDLQSTVDLNGKPVDPVSPITLRMTPQKIRKRYMGTIEQTPPIVSIPNGEYFQLDFDKEEISEIAEKHLLPRVVTSELPTWMFTIGESGDYEIDLEICAGENVVGNDIISANTRYKCYIQFNEQAAIQLTETNIEFGDDDEFTKYTYSDTVALLPNDTIRIYIERIDIGGGSFCLFGTDPSSYVPGGFIEPSTIDPDFYNLINPHLTINGDTTYPETDAPAFFAHDVASAILARIGLGDQAFYSEVFGSPITKTRQYNEYGCYSNFALLKGLHIRGYTLEEKHFFISFKDWWDIVNPIFNLGLGYEKIEGKQVIRVEQKEHFLNTTPSVVVSNVRDISYKYDLDHIHKRINVGYKEWEAESAGGIDDPQTKRTYATRLRH